jgi:PilZ domain
MTDDRRHHARIAFQTAATLVLADRQIPVGIRDLSLKGALVDLPAGTVLKNEAVCVLHLDLDESEAPARISMEARVAHCAGRCAGLLCLNIDLDSVTHLRRLVELNLGDPSLLERELAALLAE